MNTYIVNTYNALIPYFADLIAMAFCYYLIFHEVFRVGHSTSYTTFFFFHWDVTVKLPMFNLIVVVIGCLIDSPTEEQTNIIACFESA